MVLLILDQPIKQENILTKQNKMAKEKKVDEKQTLQQQLDTITFSNKQAQKVRAIQEGRQKISDSFGKNKSRYVSSTEGVGNKIRRVSSAGRIAGLQTLGNSFGK